jgi:dTDP-4-amino-4,6-dideoxygalactose transaminase
MVTVPDHRRVVPLIKADLPPFDELAESLREMLATGRVTNFGRHVGQLEHDVGRYLGTPATCVSSATAGLILTLQALDVPGGSGVAMPSFTFVATAQAALYAGCRPVFVDVASDGNADADDLARLLRSDESIRAVVLVHLYGLPCDTGRIAAVVDEAGRRRGCRIPVVYDAAHAFGSARDGIRVGGAGDAEVFSTSVTKVMTSVEGGIITTKDGRLADRLRRMRNYGIHSSYDAHWPGLNGKMSELHALVGIHNLARLDQLLSARQARASYSREHIEGRTSFRAMAAPPGVLSTFKDFTIVVPAHMKQDRDAVMRRLADEGIETRAYFFPPVHEQRYFRRFADRPLPITEDLSRRVITLPFSSTITTGELDRVVGALAEAEASIERVRASGAETRA